MAQWEDKWGIPHDYDPSVKSRADSEFTYRGHKIGSRFAEVPMWPVVTGLAVAFIWAVNVLSPGALSFITGYSFIDSVMLGVIISALYILSVLRTREHDTMAEEIMEKLAHESGRETGAGTEEEYPAWQNNTMKNGN